MYTLSTRREMKMQKLIVTLCHEEYEKWRRSEQRAKNLCQSFQSAHCIYCILHHWHRFLTVCIGGIEHLEVSYRKVFEGYYSFKVTMAPTGKSQPVRFRKKRRSPGSIGPALPRNGRSEGFPLRDVCERIWNSLVMEVDRSCEDSGSRCWTRVIIASVSQYRWIR